jgi:hypothetical protein
MMGTLWYPTFAVCVVLYNIVVTFSSFIFGLFNSPDSMTVFSIRGVDTGCYSLAATSNAQDPLQRFPGVHLSEVPFYDARKKS